MRILFLHPDLGIGGAERLIVDAALALKTSGHDVHIITNYHDPNHCFKETIDGTLNVSIVGNWFPRNIFGRFQAFCAYLRLIIAALWLTLMIPADHYLNDTHAIIIDQISAPIPIVKLTNWFVCLFGSTRKRPKILFYCHFPDLLLTPRSSLIKKLYRLPIDWIEELSTGMSDAVVVNSKFTQNVFRRTFKSLSNTPLQVLYPSVQFDSFDKPIKSNLNLNLDRKVDTIFLSINRYERKKNLDLAIRAFDCLLKKSGNKLRDKKRVHLIIAGGYDERVIENMEYFNELSQLVNQLEISDQITFLKSPSDDEKRALLHSASSVIYTPANEHFGIVPLEAMYMKRPVIAVASGGPLETIVDGETGFLCSSGDSGVSMNAGDQFTFKTNDEALINSFADAMLKFVLDKSLGKELGVNGHERVKRYFSFSSFREQLDRIINELIVD